MEFVSHGAVLRGWLYQAAEPQGASKPGPAIVMAHGLSAVREMFLDSYAAAFAAAGFPTLAYDHFGFGASDGDPRQCPAPSLQLEGYRDAVAWLGSQPGVDSGKLGIWGSSFSGGEVIVLASEGLPIGCAVAQVPFLGEGGPDLPSGALGVITEALVQGRDDATLPAVTSKPDGMGVMYEDDAYHWFSRVAAERAPNWRNEIRLSGLIEPFRPIDCVGDSKMPLLLVVATDDRLTPPGPLRDLPVPGNVEIVEIRGGHFDAYESGFDKSASVAIGWFQRHLMV